MVSKQSLRSISRKTEFSKLKADGSKFWASPWLLIFYRKSELGAGLALSISSKSAKAVTRNKLKRWSRELMRKVIREQSSFSFEVHLIFKRMPDGFYDGLSFTDFKDAFGVLLRRLFRQEGIFVGKSK